MESRGDHPTDARTPRPVRHDEWVLAIAGDQSQGLRHFHAALA